MPEFTLHRNYVLRTTKGHAISFKKGTPTYVPPICVEDAVAIGARPVAEEIDILPDDSPDVVLTAQERMDKIAEAIQTMVARNERNDFTGSGLPDIRRMNAIVGFDVTKPERDAAWQRYREEVAEETLINPQTPDQDEAA